MNCWTHFVWSFPQQIRLGDSGTRLCVPADSHATLWRMEPGGGQLPPERLLCEMDK